MQNIDLICVGKLNAKYFAEGVAEYQKRLAAFAAFGQTAGQGMWPLSSARPTACPMR